MAMVKEKKMTVSVPLRREVFHNRYRVAVKANKVSVPLRGEVFHNEYKLAFESDIDVFPSPYGEKCFITTKNAKGEEVNEECFRPLTGRSVS